MLYTYGFLFVSDGDEEFDEMPELNDLSRQLHNENYWIAPFEATSIFSNIKLTKDSFILFWFSHSVPVALNLLLWKTSSSILCLTIRSRRFTKRNESLQIQGYLQHRLLINKESDKRPLWISKEGRETKHRNRDQKNVHHLLSRPNYYIILNWYYQKWRTAWTSLLIIVKLMVQCLLTKL